MLPSGASLLPTPQLALDAEQPQAGDQEGAVDPESQCRGRRLLLLKQLAANRCSVGTLQLGWHRTNSPVCQEGKEVPPQS